MQNNIEFVTDKNWTDCFRLQFPPLFAEYSILLRKLKTIKGIKIQQRYIDVYPPCFYLEEGVVPQQMYTPVTQAIKECFGDKYTVSQTTISAEGSWSRFRKKMRKKGYDF